MNDGVKFDENATCESCGVFGAYLFDGKHLCAECYGARGSCCSESDPEAACDIPDDSRRKDGAGPSTSAPGFNLAGDERPLPGSV